MIEEGHTNKLWMANRAISEHEHYVKDRHNSAADEVADTEEQRKAAQEQQRRTSDKKLEAQFPSR
jgi:hypothetical protein